MNKKKEKTMEETAESYRAASNAAHALGDVIKGLGHLSKLPAISLTEACLGVFCDVVVSVGEQRPSESVYLCEIAIKTLSLYRDFYLKLVTKSEEKELYEFLEKRYKDVEEAVKEKMRNSDGRSYGLKPNENGVGG